MEEGVYIGEIRLLAFPFVPVGWAACEGQFLNIMSNQALYSLIGTLYGGDGRTTFALPNLKGAEPVTGGMKYYIAIQGLYPMRN